MPSFHYFRFDGQDYAVNLRRMLASKVSLETARALALVRAGEPLPALSPESARQIGDLRLNEPHPEDTAASPPSGRTAPASPARGAAPHLNERATTMALFVTQHCNLRCTYCYGDGGGYGNPGVMPEATALRAVDWLLARCGQSQPWISFFGGEPFLNFPLMRKVARYARERTAGRKEPMRFTVTTNLTLLSKRHLDFIEEFDVHAIASFDGPRQVFDRMRRTPDGSSVYDLAAPRLARLMARRPGRVNVRATLDARSDPAEAEAEFARLGVRTYHMTRAARSLFAPPGDTLEAEHFQARRQAHMADKTRRFLDALRGRDRETLGALLPGLECGMPQRCDISKNGVAFLSRKKFHCGMGRGYLAVDVTGGIYPCHRFVGQEHLLMGSVFGASALPKDYENAFIDSNDECRSCWARHFCGGGCQHEHAGETGSLVIPSSTVCEHQRFLAEMRVVNWTNVLKDDLAWLVNQGLASHEHCFLDFG